MGYSLKGKKIWVAGHHGMVGSALVRRLQGEGCIVLTVNRGELDLTRQLDVETWISEKRPDAIFLAAAKVGGILANDMYPANFIYQNLMIEANIIQAAFLTSVEKLLFLGSSCIYPKMASQPMNEAALLTGPLEPTNEWYAIAKIAGIKMCQAYRKQYGCNFISAMPTNLYGPGDNYHPENSHVVPALIRKAHEAKLAEVSSIEVWGSGKPMREFLHVDDAADAMVYLMKNYSSHDHVNVGTGKDVTIAELVDFVCSAVGYQGNKVYDSTKPDGTPRKLMDVTKLTELGWSASIDLAQGLKSAYDSFVSDDIRSE